MIHSYPYAMKNIAVPLCLITVFACSPNAAATDIPERTYHDHIRQICDTTILLNGSDTEAKYKAIEMRGRVNVTECQGLSPEYLGVIWGAESANDYYSAVLQCSNDAYNHFIEAPYVLLKATHHTPDSIIEIGQWKIKSNIAYGKKDNTIAVELNAANNSVKLLAGNKSLHLIHQFTSTVNPTLGYSGVTTYGCADISLLVTEQEPDLAASLSTPWTLHDIEDYLSSASHNGIEGFWKYLDRDNDERYCRLGGKYTVAIIKSGDGYDILFIDGAQTNSPLWHAGMKKGHLTPTIFENHYDLTWFDATFRPASDECNATIEQNAILTLNFPLLKSSIRLSKMPTGK